MVAFIGALIENQDLPIPGIGGDKSLEAVLAYQKSAEIGCNVNL